jgi:nucleoside-diphosphate kinase
VKWRQIIGPTNLEVAKRDAPGNLRAQCAKSTTENFAHGSDAPGSAARELGIIFIGKAAQLLSALNDTALLIAKPRAAKAHYAGISDYGSRNLCTWDAAGYRVL